MKKLIALSIIASAISGTVALADDAQQGTTDKSNAVAQQLADNTATTPAQNSAQAAPAVKKAKHHRHHTKKLSAKKPVDAVTQADATPAASDTPAAQ
ncbi:MAG: hypothetical protein ACD_60C00079G0039 [uncultured bacterium]|nr:MAG: hypothetical protein ACD_60C00079G0039 [uncultured bacterium]